VQPLKRSRFRRPLTAFFNKKAIPDLAAFLERLDPFLSEWPADVPVAVEIRNKR
jgi:hypothetical protein